MVKLCVLEKKNQDFYVASSLNDRKETQHLYLRLARETMEIEDEGKTEMETAQIFCKY